ncbi:MAG: glycosyltransferase family 2 protein [Candidatus Woesearchaeota archaeon]
MISVVIPVFNEEKNIKPMYKKIKSALKKIKGKHEIIYVDDGSSDNTFKELSSIHKKDKMLKAIRFQRNYGKATALAAGFEKAKGDIIVTMDGDLQDEPEEMRKLIKKLDGGYGLVTGWKQAKHKGSLRRVPSRIFNLMARRLTHLQIHDFNCPFKAYKADAAKGLCLYGQMHRYIPALVKWQGYDVAEVPVLNYERLHGTTKYSSGRILKGFLDLITVKYLMSYKTSPLYLFGSLGIGMGFFGLIIAAYLSVLWFLGQKIGDRPLLMLAVLLIILGIQLGSIGLIGEMTTYNAEKSGKNYSIRDELG